MFLAGYMVTFFGFRHMTALPQCTDEMLELFFTYNSLNVIMMTIPFFLIAKKVKVRSELIQRMLANLTVCGFGIYMFHRSGCSPDAQYRCSRAFTNSRCRSRGIWRIVAACGIHS